jgi:Chlamydia polymorphic membrane protein (Chlamydia_PMP).
MQHSPLTSLRKILLLLLTMQLVCASFFLSATMYAADTPTIVYVNASATGANNGTSWQNAYKDLQQALATAPMDSQIWVARGVYYPTNNTGNRGDSFVLKNRVALYGGFAGNEDQLDKRDWRTNLTILSGDIGRDDSSVNGIVTSVANINGSNSYHVVESINDNSSAILDGFVITAGRANGLLTQSAGGGLYISNSNPTISNVSFSGNAAIGYGGAIFNSGSEDLLNITNATFSGNSAGIDGGAIHTEGGPVNITNATFSGNSAINGGAISNTASFLIVATEAKVKITNASFSGNRASQFGGAIYQAGLPLSSGTIMNITNATFSGNSAELDGGAIYFGILNFNLNNSIIWGNSSPAVGQLGLVLSTTNHSLVQGCNPNGTWTTSNCGLNGIGNLAPTDPLFVSPVNHQSAPTQSGDLRLQANSPMIDKGSNVINTTTNDLDEKPRIMGSTIDLGAYETAYQLNKVVIGSGEISHTPNSDWYEPNTTLNLTAVAQPGWSFAGWSGDLSGSSSSNTLVMNNNKEVTATFSNDPPTANAGADQTVVAGTLVTLDGSASSDADPTQTLSYQWTQTGGPSVTLANAQSAKPSFTALSTAGTLTFILIVKDDLGLASTMDSVTITVTNDPNDPNDPNNPNNPNDPNDPNNPNNPNDPNDPNNPNNPNDPNDPNNPNNPNDPNNPNNPNNPNDPNDPNNPNNPNNPNDPNNPNNPNNPNDPNNPNNPNNPNDPNDPNNPNNPNDPNNPNNPNNLRVYLPLVRK